MDRRAFLATVGMGLVAVPITGRAQQVGKVWRIAILTATPRPAPDSSHYYNNLPNELRQLGYREGQNLLLEWRSTGGIPEQRRREAAALMDFKPDLIVAGGGFDGLVLKELTTTIPIVVAGGGDLVAMGLVSSLARPGGNVTGLQMLQPELQSKKLELVMELMPKVDRVGVFHHQANRTGTTFHRAFGE